MHIMHAHHDGRCGSVPNIPHARYVQTLREHPARLACMVHADVAGVSRTSCMYGDGQLCRSVVHRAAHSMLHECGSRGSDCGIDGAMMWLRFCNLGFLRA
ncbi:hypothetical protein F511_20432 [Dorcoceras hygrometricum]|uniref:Uncharacterized protein n=1 Tax=Dorcoceras hygrometricum TaxID=472368 RepID=A0A2Z7DDY8_9LAMI|nr:hypothetical protein F511_20432 [Dorcoceras hygrometricum]